MRTPVAPFLLGRLSAYITAQLGLSFPQERWPALERGLHAAATDAGFDDVPLYCRWLMSSSCNKNQLAQLASHLTIGETYFFRDKTMFEIFEQRILPPLIEARRKSTRHLNIWSAGCCTGEEPYSVAILLSRLLPDWQDWSVTILGTDINSRFLQKAVQGVYSEWSFRDVAPWLKARYFRRTGAGHYEIRPPIKQRVTFSQLNLADETYPQWLDSGRPFDIIFCRNVLMYFADEQARKTVQKLYTTLAEGGWLAVSPSDATDALLSPLVQDSNAGAFFYQRQAKVHLAPHKSTGQTLLLEQAPRVLTALEQPSPGAGERQNDEENNPAAAQEALGLPAQHPQTGQVAMRLALVYANQGKLAQARQWCERAIVADRMNPGVYYLQATIQQEQGDLPGAQISLRQALYLDPHYVLAHFALGYCALRQGKIAEANKCFANTRVFLNAYGADAHPPGVDGLTSSELMEIVRIIDQVH